MTTLRWIPAAAQLSVFLAAAAAADVPRQPADFTINLVGGKTVSLNQYRGHPIVLLFILTHCAHCQETVGVLTRLQNEYGPRGLQVLASAIDADARETVPNFIRNFSPSFPVGYNSPVASAALIQPTGKSPMMPLIAFIDKQGIIRNQHEGEEPFFNDLEQNLRKEIDTLLRSGTPAKKSPPK
jgi:thiol-disulfide isomerase/thioredoxin